MTTKWLRATVSRHFSQLVYDSYRIHVFIDFCPLLTHITYACHAGTMVHAAKGWTHHEVSQVNVEEMEETWQGARELGFYLSEVNEKRK